jgi:tetratricopeptide (TPR) repeat protein
LRGLAYKLLDDYEKSFADLNRAIEIDPHLATHYNQRANTYFRMKEFAKAA